MSDEQWLMRPHEHELKALLDQARQEPKPTRIHYRDAVAGHRKAAADVMQRWLAEPELAAFAVRVLENIATNGDRGAAMAALQAVAPMQARGSDGTSTKRSLESGDR